MPITPSEARQRNKSRNSASYKSIVKRIDEMLVEGGRTFATDILDGVDANEIIADYQAAGWKVRFVPDWRDGNYLEFSE